MLTIELGAGIRSTYRILCLGSHSDDIEIGCGGTVLKLIEKYPKCEFSWVVFSAEGQRKQEALKSAGLFLEGASKRKVAVLNFKTSFFPYEGARIKEAFERLKKFQPDLVLTHYRHDLHQDHRVVCDLTWNTFRDHLILEYEIPKYDGDLGVPNFFVKLDEGTCDRKVRHILDCFKTQRNKHWFSEDTFRALLRLRGMESCSKEKFAEAFYSRKVVLKA